MIRNSRFHRGQWGISVLVLKFLWELRVSPSYDKTHLMTKESVEAAKERAIARRAKRENDQRVVKAKGPRLFDQLTRAIDTDIREFNGGEGLTGSVAFSRRLKTCSL